MELTGWMGLVLALAAGAIIGAVLLPMKWVRKWAWENTWFVYAACAYLLSPWIVAAWTVPHLFAVYARTDASVLVVTTLLGFGWGFAVVLVGIAFDLVGITISTALLYGVSVALGSIGALLLVDRARLFTPAGLAVLLWDLVLLAGVGLCARGSSLRDGETPREGSRLRRGIAVSLLAGLLSTMFNLALAYGAPLQRRAMIMGADPNFASNAIWAPAVSAGSLPSLLWCAWLLTRNGTWGRYRLPGSFTNFLRCAGMGVAWITGTVLYGAATVRLGRFGTAVGWPVYLSAVILTGNVLGLIMGEWSSAPRRALNWLWGGIALQVLSIVLLSVTT